MYRRVSGGERGQDSAFNDSLDRQMTFLDQFAPAGTGQIRLDQVSIGRDSSPVTAEIAQYENALFLVTSLDRISRTRQGLLEVRKASRERNVHILAFLFPGAVVQQLAELDDPPLDDDDVREDLDPATAHANARSLPAVWPTIVAGVDLDDEVRAIVGAQAERSEEFLRAYAASSYIGNTRIKVPNELSTKRAFTADRRSALRNEIMRVRPQIACAIEFEALTGRAQAYTCECEEGDCDEGCSCRCGQCDENYHAACHPRQPHLTLCPCIIVDP
jgi:hypothetical protein